MRVMNTGMTSQISTDSSGRTELLAASMGSRLRGGEVIVLTSDLGGGKTAFVRGLARGAGSDDHVASPTFTIGREYKVPDKDIRICHFDFYRLHEPGIVALELDEVIHDPRAAIVIEWGEIVENVLPETRMLISIDRTGENSRTFSFSYPESLAYLLPGEAV
jgi:tRNA threonylcarbamoyladenosine biosynthesis protein TsaE